MRLRIVELWYCVLGMVLELVCHGLKARQRRASKPEGGEQEVKSKIRADQKLR